MAKSSTQKLKLLRLYDILLDRDKAYEQDMEKQRKFNRILYLLC